MFRLSVNVDQVASFLQRQAAEIGPRVKAEVEALSVSAHAFIIQRAQEQLRGHQLERFLGENGKNVRWNRVGSNMWVVEIDESARDIEEGHDRRFMAWLLNNNPKAKTAKDGSKYAHIPMSKSQFTGPAKQAVNAKNAMFQGTIARAMKEAKISPNRIERHENGEPKLGVLHSLRIEPPGTQTQFPALYSAPRPPEMATLTGLPAHTGIPLLQGLVVTQRMQGKKVVREAVTFRTISSKHEGEGRWFQAATPGIKTIEAAHQYAVTQWEEIVKGLEREFRNQA